MRFYEEEQGKASSARSSFKKGKQICLICGGKEDWKCRQTEDERLALCSYVASERTDTTGKRYIHILAGQTEKSPAKTQLPRERKDEHIALAETLDTAYRCLLGRLELGKEHKANLQARGLNEQWVEKSEYKSVPAMGQRFEIAKQVNDEAGDLDSVPGFYLEDDQWSLHMTFAGIYIPFRDVDGNIVGLQIRRDDASEGARYMWLSTRGKDGGASSGTPLHFANPDAIGDSNTVYVTEGGLKADVIASLSNVAVVAEAGAGSVKPKMLSKAIFDAFPDVEKIIVAYDADWRNEQAVKAALIRLLEELRGDSVVEVYVATWDEALGKGLDDVWINENYQDGMVNLVPVDEFLMFSNEGDVDSPQPQKTAKAADEVDNVFVHPWGSFSKLDFPDSDKVVFGLGRGNVGLMVATTNVGKTTYCLNLALSAVAGRAFLPMVGERHGGKRVLYVDGEATKAELQADIRTMTSLFGGDEIRAVCENLFLICDEELYGAPLDLVDPCHLLRLQAAALQCSADLIIIDTLSALFGVEDENDNAKIRKEVMIPLKTLAKKADAAVLLLHHSGKFSEGLAPQGAYKGRGASALGALSRTVLNLQRDESGDNRVVLSCPKSKGMVFTKKMLELNPDTRWFSAKEEVVKELESVPYKKVVDFVREAGRIVRRKEIDNETGIRDASLTRILKKAVLNADIDNPKHGHYSCSNAQQNNHELALAE